MKHTTMTRTVTNKKEAEFYISKGAKLFNDRNNKWLFDQEDTRTLRLEWLILEK